MEGMTRQSTSDAVDPLGWRLVLGVLVTHVPVGSLTDAARVATAAVDAAGAEGPGHLTAELFADRVVLRLQDVAVGDVTATDVALARRITDALGGIGSATVAGDAVAPQTLEIAIDASDIARVRPFWQAVTGYVDEPHPADLPPNALSDPLRRSPTIWFQQMDPPRGGRNRIHLDVDVPPERVAARMAAALAAGGRLVSDAAAPSFWVLADPEGNEACLCTWQGRD
ncbi:4a-hydroxytetrahydrobiopterin dehydratase [Mycolicibacterium grossiae]|uniref:4a-hydroxytetrahydrobiopterin dehydratase n=2 Tax=Mycolicibacterium grossiae TaxID=1552759 RepID=A0A1E8QAF2_9MYCO|nr:4a-hydroxytetrahydrobiopterin dehydratase [Mycolicibacterium grossiae]